MPEIELKFLADPELARTVWQRVRQHELAAGPRTTRHLRSIYFDTPGRKLKRAGIALRLRRDGRDWLQTIKLRGRMAGGLSHAEEDERPAPSGRLILHAADGDGPLATVRRVIGDAPVGPVCESAIRRTAMLLALPDGTLAELAVDVGLIIAGQRSAPLHEIELELKHGTVGALFDLALLLLPDGGMRFSRLSKAARGYRLAEGNEIEPPLAPRDALPIPLDPDMTVEQAARAILRECVDQTAANLVAVERLDDPEAAHQLRVALGRLRSAIALFRPLLAGERTAAVNAEARALGVAVGALRDLDVVSGDIVAREAAAHSQETGLSALAEALSAEAAEQRRALRTLIANETSRRLPLELLRYAEAAEWHRPDDPDQARLAASPVADFSVEALDAAWRRVRRRARRLRSLDVAQRHELRKALKTMRYATEFFADLHAGKRAAAFGRKLRRLQEVFGEMNDVAAASRVLETFAARDQPANIHRAVGWVLGAGEARAELVWERAREQWEALEKAGPYWE